MSLFQEGALNKLQQHVEEQEIHWRHQLKAKDGEIEELKANTVNKLRDAVTSLETELRSLREEKRLLEQQLESAKCSSSTATIQRLTEVISFWSTFAWVQ